jgi:hypothetical protein
MLQEIIADCLELASKACVKLIPYHHIFANYARKIPPTTQDGVCWLVGLDVGRVAGWACRAWLCGDPAGAGCRGWGGTTTSKNQNPGLSVGVWPWTAVGTLGGRGVGKRFNPAAKR